MSEDNVSIKGLSKAAVLAALYNNGRVQGLGILHARNGDMTEEQAQKEIDAAIENAQRRGITRRAVYFDYLHGRVLKVDLTTDEIEPYLYDRDNGDGKLKAIVEALRQKEGG